MILIWVAVDSFLIRAAPTQLHHGHGDGTSPGLTKESMWCEEYPLEAGFPVLDRSLLSSVVDL